MASPPPTVRSSATSGESSATTSHTVDLPSDVWAGDLLLRVFSVTDTGATTDPAGATEFGTIAAQGNRLTVSGSIADGTEGGTSETWTTAGSAESAHIALAIKGWYGDLTEGTGWDISTGADGSSTFLNPDTVSASWGTDSRNLFIALSGYNNDDEAITAWPADYDDNQISSLSGGGAANGNGVVLATRVVTAASQNPGSFRTANPQGWNAFTIAIRPSTPGGLLLPPTPQPRRHMLNR